MDWQQCIKDLKGKTVRTYKGDLATIRSFDLKCSQLGHKIGKYQVSFWNGTAVGWYTWSQLTIVEVG